MFRRQFVQIFAAVGATGVAALASKETKATRSVTYVVKGFSCVTCAVGLDTMLEKQKGIRGCKSTYPEGRVNIQYDPEQMTERAIEGFIAEMGFTVAERKPA